MESNLPSADQSNEAKAASDLQQLQNVRQRYLASHDRWNSGISSGDESEQKDESEEQAHE